MILAIVIFSAMGLNGQTIITITEDTVFDTTLVFTEDTILEGEGYPSVTFLGNPKIIVKDCRVLIKSMRLQNMQSWGTIKGNACLEWHSVGMIGMMAKGNYPITDYFLDGLPRQ